VSSWEQVPDVDLIKLGKYVFSLKFIIEYVTNRLNSSNMNNPYPSYPVNPFTIERLSVKLLGKIKKQIILSQANVPLPTKVFLEEEDLWVDDDGRDVNYNDICRIVDRFEARGLRFKRLNCKDSQDNITGYWVRKECPLSKFEVLTDKYNRTFNILYKNKMDRLPVEHVICDDMEMVKIS
jgi:hypothetical protein